MTFVDAIRSGFKNYANFKGVAARSEFWYWVLFGFLLQLVTNTIDSMLGTNTLTSLVQLGLFLPGLAMAARRLRDSGRTPLWLLSLLGIILSFVWLVVTFALEFAPLFGSYSAEQLQAAIDEFDLKQTGPIADALSSGAFDGSLVPFVDSCCGHRHRNSPFGVLLLSHQDRGPGQQVSRRCACTIQRRWWHHRLIFVRLKSQ